MNLRSSDPETLIAAAAGGDKSAISRLISLIERGGDPARRVSRLTYGRGDSYTVGLTGAPGAGKSTLTSCLIAEIRAAGRPVAVLAVDPSSPFTGGAILGDRVRMQDHALDEGVFIRSMATRGHLGGLALATPEAVRVLAAAGIGLVLVETVGVGQVEVDIARAADTTVVVVNPGWGDTIQANKAGLLEIADVFVINKADRPGVAETRRDLDNMLDMSSTMGPWRPPIVSTVASTGEGVGELWAAVAAHREHLERSGELALRRTARLCEELSAVLARGIEQRVAALEGGARYQRARDEVVSGACDPYTAAEDLLEALGL